MLHQVDGLQLDLCYGRLEDGVLDGAGRDLGREASTQFTFFANLYQRVVIFSSLL